LAVIVHDRHQTPGGTRVSRPIPDVAIDPFSEAFLADPYPGHAAMREAGPVVHIPAYGFYAMARFADVNAGLRDWETYSSARGVGLQDFAKEEPWRPKSIVLETDPPLHDRTRRVLQRVMSPVAMRALRAPARVKAEALVDRLVSNGTIEAVSELAEAFPLAVFPDAVGVVEHGRENLLPYSTMVFNSFGPRNALFEHSIKEAGKVVAWILTQCEREALAPDGFGAAIWAAHDAGEIAADEARILVRSLLTAGIDTTVNGFGSALLAFATHPGEWDRARADPTLLKVAFDEVLRWESPVQTFFRTTTRDVTVGPHVVPQGSKVLLFLGAANRDPDKWPEPERFDVARRPLGHVGLGAGIHVCVGQLVARLESEVLFEVMAERIKRFEFAGTPTRRLNNTLRCLETLPLRLIPT
jgi:cytochrome P450